jgi:hypothetical protein
MAVRKLDPPAKDDHSNIALRNDPTRIDPMKVKLGKSVARHDPRTLLMAAYLAPSLPNPPAAFDLTTKIKSWGMMENDQIGDCTCAAAGHLIMEWTANAGKKLFTPSDKQIVDAYSAITGYNPTTGANDNGAVELDVLNYWRQTGIAGHKIGAFVALEPANHEHVMDAVFMFEGCYIGVQLPISAQAQTKNHHTWSVPPGGPHGNGEKGSWGGHAIPVVAYDAHTVTVVTWGALQRMTWSFWEAYCDEAYAILSEDYMDGTKKAPQGFSMAELEADLQDLK